MDQSKKKQNSSDQFEYLGRWVDKKAFRAFVFNSKNEQKLANSYDEYMDLTTSGIWFASKEDASQPKRKLKDVVRTDR